MTTKTEDSDVSKDISLLIFKVIYFYHFYVGGAGVIYKKN